MPSKQTVKRRARTRLAGPRTTGRDQALLSEVIGYLRGAASGYNDDDKGFQWPEALASGLDGLRLRLWALDR